VQPRSDAAAAPCALRLLRAGRLALRCVGQAARLDELDELGVDLGVALAESYSTWPTSALTLGSFGER
jgi:hypothetical protein